MVYLLAYVNYTLVDMDNLNYIRGKKDRRNRVAGRKGLNDGLSQGVK
jgi:hypothetical protein